MESVYPAPKASKLKSGPPPRFYGAVPPKNSRPFNRPNHGVPPRTPYFAAPGPAPIRPRGITPHPIDIPIQMRTPRIFTRGLAICLAVMLLQTVLIICRSDVFAKFIDLESATIRASRERSALVAEREKSEQERDKMRRDRELWEKAREDRIPQGAFWEAVWPAWDCRAYGKREYWGILQNIPKGWSAIDACMNMPVEIKGVNVRRPDRCAFVSGSPHIHGYWMVNWEQPDCKPWHQEYRDAGCTSYRSGTRRIEAHLVGINNRKEQDWRLLCSTTPFVWDQITYASPTHCDERRGGRKVAMWDIPDEGCL